jgi:hypothetical protein
LISDEEPILLAAESGDFIRGYGRGLSAVVAIGYYGEVGPASIIAAGSRSHATKAN